MNGPRNVVFLLLLAVILVAVPVTGLAAADYSISADPSMETPTETGTFEGKEYTISSVTPVTAGDTISVQTSVPDESGHYINFRGPENQIISSDRKTGDASHTIDYFGAGEAGTYAITIQDGGSTQTIQPVVLQGYDITVSAPSEVEAGDPITIEADVTERSIEKHSAFDRVEFVIGNEDVEIRERMSQADDGTYTATVTTDSLESKSYDVYVAVRGDEEVRKRAEILGVSDDVSFAVTDPSTGTPTESNPGTSPGSEPGESTETSTPTTTPAETVTPTPTSTDRSTATPTLREDPTPSPSDQTPTATESSGVINPSTSTPTDTADADGSGFTALLTSLTLLGLLFAHRRF
jgi:hypothetical protein